VANRLAQHPPVLVKQIHYSRKRGMKVSEYGKVRRSLAVLLLPIVFVLVLSAASQAKTVVTMTGHEYTRQMFEQHAA